MLPVWEEVPGYIEAEDWKMSGMYVCMYVHIHSQQQASSYRAGRLKAGLPKLHLLLLDY